MLVLVANLKSHLLLPLSVKMNQMMRSLMWQATTELLATTNATTVTTLVVKECHAEDVMKMQVAILLVEN